MSRYYYRKSQTTTRTRLRIAIHGVFELPIDEQTYKDIMSRHPSGVTVVTTVDDRGVASGLTVSAFCTVSLDPPSLLVVIDKKSQSLPILLAGKGFTVSLLAKDTQDLALHFASKDEDKFGKLPAGSVADLETGPALVADANAYLECITIQKIESGDHWILVGGVERGKILSGEDPLVYSHRRFRVLE